MKNTLNYFKLLKNMNWPMAVAVIVLLVTGVFFVYSSCYVSEEHPVRTLYKRQVVWALAGLLCYLVLTMNDYRQLSKIAWWGYAATIFLLILVPFIGKTIYGAKRWLMRFGDNGIGIQPSELAKLATIFVLAKRLSRPELDLKKIQTFFITLLIVFVPVLLVMKQPDLGTAMVFLPTAFVIMFSAGVPFRFLGTILAIGITIVALLLSALFLPQALGANESTQKRVRAMTGLSEYQHGRIQVFFNPETDPLGAGWNKRQSEIAVGSGGITGKGFRKGTQNILG
ncbi:FtsW/RodA/SpoVE family cell cycle protein, partial [PVC group bacterium]|nr:FtsW/RodA/SpoVE family cell cycle protein [PVC group bacterium]